MLMLSNLLSMLSALVIKNGLALFIFPDIVKIDSIALIDKVTDDK